MKKILSFLFVLASVITFAQTPITKKTIGTDSITGLTKELQVWQLTVDTKAEKVTVVYDEVLLAPNGKIASVLNTNNYTRVNILEHRNSLIDTTLIPADMRFDSLRYSPVGIAIKGMIEQTINGYPNLEQH